jgi:hypothetical protein
MIGAGVKSEIDLVPAQFDNITNYLNREIANTSHSAQLVAMKACMQTILPSIYDNQKIACIESITKYIIQYRHEHGSFASYLVTDQTGSKNSRVEHRHDFTVDASDLIQTFLNLNYSENIECTLKHSNLNRERHESSDIKQAVSMTKKSYINGAIVILTHEKKLPYLSRCLDLLYKYYNSVHRNDVLIFHDGDISDLYQRRLQVGRPEVQFRILDASYRTIHPSTLEAQAGRGASFNIGYRHMIRFFAIRIWPLLHELGYTYAMRLDDDSAILSTIPYDVFQYMEKYNYQYAYRTLQVVRAGVEMPADSWYDTLKSFVVKKQLKHFGDILETCDVKNSLADFNQDNCGNLPGG